MHRNRKIYIVAFLLMVAPPISLSIRSQEHSRRVSAIIKQVDHIVIPTYEGDGLYSLLTDTLQFPVVKPYQANPKGFKNGGVCAGNVNLEVISVRSDDKSSTEPMARFGNVAFEPGSLATSLRELEARGIAFTGPFPDVGTDPDGQQRLRWTNVGLTTLRSGFSPFLCEYNFDVGARRRVCQQELEKRKGGPMGLQHVMEIVIGAKDLDDTIVRWQNVLSPIESMSRGWWRIGDGPSIRLVQSDKNSIQRLILKVRSLKRQKGSWRVLRCLVRIQKTRYRLTQAEYRSLCQKLWKWNLASLFVHGFKSGFLRVVFR